MKGITKLLVAKGKKVVEFDLNKDRPDDDTLTALLLGPTGNLRAPTVKVGKTMLVGFDQQSYSKALTK